MDKITLIWVKVWEYSDWSVITWRIIAVDIYDRYIIEFDGLKDDVFISTSLSKDNIYLEEQREEMTLEEIETELGRKIKIVDK